MLQSYPTFVCGLTFQKCVVFMADCFAHNCSIRSSIYGSIFSSTLNGLWYYVLIHPVSVDVLSCYRGATSVVHKCEQKGTHTQWAVKIINKKVWDTQIYLIFLCLRHRKVLEALCFRVVHLSICPSMHRSIHPKPCEHDI